MGGGASSIGVEELIQSTYIIGRAIAAITFPGMYRIYDFHSPKAPKLKSAKQFVFFDNDSDDDDEDDEIAPQDPSQYEHFFKVMVNDEAVYLEDVLYENEAGWTALHTCCMSFITAPAGQAIADEVARMGGSLNGKTRVGPGTFNRGWSALHMSCAYGVEPMVEKLLSLHADPNATNSYGYTPLLEACHRGFAGIVQLLVKGGVDIDYMPPEELSASSPFVAAPAHTALGEAARCGFQKIVQILLDAGAKKDAKNALGWTPLHEAAFYNRTEVVKILLLAGADASIRTNSGVLPYHLSGLSAIRTMIQEMGGREAVPEEGDVIDMIDILRELTPIDSRYVVCVGHDDEDDYDDDAVRRSISAEEEGRGDAHASSEATAEATPDARAAKRDGARKARAREQKGQDDDFNDRDNVEAKAELLHSGQLLGDLPSLNHRGSPGGLVAPEGKGSVGAGLAAAIHGGVPLERLSKKADDKKAGKKKKKRLGAVLGGGEDEVPADMPQRFICELSHKPMSEPVKTTYGNVYDKSTILNWFVKQGHICPLTGAPLAESDLSPVEGLGDEIRQWMLNKAMGGKERPGESAGGNGASPASSPAQTKATQDHADDELYDFGGISNISRGHDGSSPTSSSAPKGPGPVAAPLGAKGSAPGAEDDDLYSF